LEVTGGSYYFVSKKKKEENILSNVTYSPNHRQTGDPMINIQSTLRTATGLCKNVSLQCYLIATVIRIQSVRCQMCVCVCMYIYIYIYIYTHTHIIYNIEKLVGQNKF
jgi:hypothetical protein